MLANLSFNKVVFIIHNHTCTAAQERRCRRSRGKSGWLAGCWAPGGPPGPPPHWPVQKWSTCAVAGVAKCREEEQHKKHRQTLSNTGLKECPWNRTHRFVTEAKAQEIQRDDPMEAQRERFPDLYGKGTFIFFHPLNKSSLKQSERAEDTLCQS